MAYTIRKSIDIDFSHHIRGHSGACINLHGHTWKFEVTVAADELDAEGFVVDFGLLKRRVLRPCHALLDHSLALGEATWTDVSGELVRMGRALLGSRAAVHGDDWSQQVGEPVVTRIHGAESRYPGGLKVAVFPFSPTSERIARWLFELASAELDDGRVCVESARVYETLHPVHAVAEYRR